MRTLTLRLAPLLFSAALCSVACANSLASGTPKREAETAAPAHKSEAPREAVMFVADDEQTTFDHSHKLLDTLLTKHVRLGFVDYRGMISGKKKLGRYIRQVTRVTPADMESWTREQRFAFWINVYNAHVIKLVSDNYPLQSIKDIGGAIFNRVWDKEFIELTAFHPDGDDDKLSLNDIEHGILRPQFEDARVHAAVNCASISCPVLMAEAFVPEKLDQQLNRQMRLFINDPSRNLIDPEQNKLQISEIFTWFEDDFKRDSGSVREYLIRFAPEDSAAFLAKTDLRYLDYDWNLNDAPIE